MITDTIRGMHRTVPLDPETLLSAYAQGAFPMSDRDGAIRWYTADPRGVIPLDDRFHIPSTLAAVVRQGKFECRINTQFEATMRACMQQRAGGTWISAPLIATAAPWLTLSVGELPRVPVTLRAPALTVVAPV